VSVVAPRGFVAVGGSCGIKAGGAFDVAVVATADGRAVPAAGVFTSNKATAAPVQVSRRHLHDTHGRAAGVVLTSGNANAATGSPGLAAAQQLCSLVAAELGSAPEEVLVCQTGLIGIPFPIEVAAAGVPAVARARAATVEAGDTAARAIMTTDTVPKQVMVAGDGFVVGGMAKGAAMLAPDMATMLAVLTTDAALDPDEAHQILSTAVRSSFNEMTVDGATSTNDTVLLLANGAAGPADREAVLAAVTEACASLARQMADDAEGATKTARVSVVGASDDAEAHRAVRQVASSLLVKCSLNGADPYWGRVVSELGSAGVAFDPDTVSVAYGGTVVCRHGVAAFHDEAAVAEHMAGRHIEIECDLGLGTGRARILTTDLGHGYIDENRTTS
jgi:glutamate N-acetyltransferase/amino-acid N-acetyltransferase